MKDISEGLLIFYNLFVFIFVFLIIFIFYYKYTYKQYDVPLLLLKRQRLIKSFQISIDALEKLNAFYWIESGTLLGAVRHKGKIIPHDDDCDISVVGIDNNQSFNSLKKIVHSLGGELRKFEAGYRVYFSTEFTDLFFRYPDEKEQRYRGNKFAEVMFPSEKHYFKHIGKRSRMIMEGREVWAPEFPIDLLKQQYGPDVLDLVCITQSHSNIIANVFVPYCYPS